MRLDPTLAKHNLLVIDNDVASGELADYVTASGHVDNSPPMLVVDDDWSVSRILYKAPLPQTLEEVLALVNQHTRGDSKKPPIPPIPPIPPRTGGDSPAPPAFSIETTDSGRFAVAEDGQMYPVNEKTQTFCVDGVCYSLEVAK
jgi:hypothetical protein